VPGDQAGGGGLVVDRQGGDGLWSGRIELQPAIGTSGHRCQSGMLPSLRMPRTPQCMLADPRHTGNPWRHNRGEDQAPGNQASRRLRHAERRVTSRTTGRAERRLRVAAARSVGTEPCAQIVGFCMPSITRVDTSFAACAANRCRPDLDGRGVGAAGHPHGHHALRMCYGRLGICFLTCRTSLATKSG
jgi:hypothetical protein